MIFEELEKDDDYFAYAVELIDGVIEKEILDSIIKERKRWDFSRVAKADSPIFFGYLVE